VRRRPRIGFVWQKWSLSRCCRRDGFISFNCARCGAAGYVHDHGCAAPDPVNIARFQAEAAEHARLHKGSRGIATETVPGGIAIADDAVMGVHITLMGHGATAATTRVAPLWY
jgi:hypothetical protein